MDEETFQCPHCGNETLNGAHFCMRCGTRLDVAAPAPIVTDKAEVDAPPIDWLAAELKLSTKSAAPAKPARANGNGLVPPPKPSTSRVPVPPVRDESKSRAPEPKAAAAAKSARGNGGPQAIRESKAPALPSPPDPIDAGFAAILAPEGAPFAPPTRDEPIPEEPLQLFKELAVGHLVPVRDLLLELEWGEARREWLEVCRPAIASLRRSSEQLANDELCRALKDLERALDHRPSNGKVDFDDRQRKTLSDAYLAVAKLLPNTEPVDVERDRREPFIVQSVLRQVPGLGQLHIDRIYAAGLNKLSMLCGARADELAAATGIPPAMAELVVAQFAYFRGRMASIAPDPQRSGERGRLEKLVTTLRKQNDACSPQARDWSREARQERLRLRHERNETALQINILLARLGEVALIEKLERLAFEHKVVELERLLFGLQQKYERSS